MKKFLSFAISLLLAVAACAQKDVTKFLGIPVDGTKSEMIRQLKAKGFTSTTFDSDILEGEFNGQDVSVHIATNNNKVYRIMICDQNTVGETDIRIRFNRLVSQFENSSKYLSMESEPISEDEDISYELTVNDKRYEAVFLQLPEIDTDALRRDILSEYSSEKPADTEAEALLESLVDSRVNLALIEVAVKKSVWFMISEYAGKYYITMFYDNEYNKANGEEL